MSWSQHVTQAFQSYTENKILWHLEEELKIVIDKNSEYQILDDSNLTKLRL